jgi:hypothetical protein
MASSVAPFGGRRVFVVREGAAGAKASSPGSARLLAVDFARLCLAARAAERRLLLTSLGLASLRAPPSGACC